MEDSTQNSSVPDPVSNLEPNINPPRNSGRKRRISIITASVFVVLFGVVGVVMLLTSHAASLANTNITVSGSGGAKTFDGVGAVLGGGGTARYLMDYPTTQRNQILDYLFKPDYGASLQLLKLEVGGDSNSSDGAEPSVEHVKGQVNCNVGYEFSIAKQAVALNPNLKLYGLQWAAPGWVTDGTKTIFTNDDIQYLMNWMSCAKKQGLTISYLGGWNESDDGTHATWFHSLREALNSNGYKSVQIVAGDSSPTWQYASSSDVNILGTHGVCSLTTTTAAKTVCTTTTAATNSGKPLWASEVGGMDSGAQSGCTTPCAPAMDRILTRGYIDARLTGYIQWPALISMPPGLNYENRGLVTANQPWSGNYNVNAMTWATAQFTQFVQPGWIYVNSSSGYLRGNRVNGSYVTLLNPAHTQWTTMIETTAGVTASQQASFTVTGGSGGLSSKTVHVWASNFNFSTGGPSQWFVKQADIKPVNGKFTFTIKPGYVYTLTTTTGQSKGKVSSIPAAKSLALPYNDNLNGPGNATGSDDEPGLLAAMYGSFELTPCQTPDSGRKTCTEQMTPAAPLMFHQSNTTGYYPYAIVGNSSWGNYTVSTDALFTASNSSAGVIGRVSGIVNAHASFNGYLFDVNAQGAWQLSKATANSTSNKVLASGQLSKPLGIGSWHTLAMSMSGSKLTASVDGVQVTAVTDASYSAGVAGIEAGATSANWPQVQYGNLSITAN